jgi:peptidoglycan-N-acetylglucosamine deacetylase
MNGRRKPRSAVETYTTPLIELLSLQQEPSGYQIEVGITQQDGQQHRIFIDVEESIYHALSVWNPMGRGSGAADARVRLSLHSRWDPFRKSAYSTLTLVTGTRCETVYYACTAEWMAALRQLKVPEQAAPAAPTVAPAFGTAVPASDKRRIPRRRSSFRFKAMRLMVISFLLLIVSMQMEGKGYNAEALSAGYAGASGPIPVPSTEVVPEIPEQPKPDQGQAEESALQAQPAALESAGASEWFDVEGDKSFYRLPEGYAALTFDDGPSVYTEKIVDILMEHQAAATFLFIGKNALQYPDAVAYASKHNMPVGNHSWDHSNLGKATASAQQENMAKANEVLEALTGIPVTIFRPPYGAVNEELQRSVKAEHMKMLLWNRDPEDWQAKTPQDILRYMGEVTPSGGIYVLHEDRVTLEALPEIIRTLKEANLKFAVFK